MAVAQRGQPFGVVNGFGEKNQGGVAEQLFSHRPHKVNGIAAPDAVRTALGEARAVGGEGHCEHAALSQAIDAIPGGLPLETDRRVQLLPVVDALQQQDRLTIKADNQAAAAPQHRESGVAHHQDPIVRRIEVGDAIRRTMVGGHGAGADDHPIATGPQAHGAAATLASQHKHVIARSHGDPVGLVSLAQHRVAASSELKLAGAQPGGAHHLSLGVTQQRVDRPGKLKRARSGGQHHIAAVVHGRVVVPTQNENRVVVVKIAALISRQVLKDVGAVTDPLEVHPLVAVEGSAENENFAQPGEHHRAVETGAGTHGPDVAGTCVAALGHPQAGIEIVDDNLAEGVVIGDGPSADTDTRLGRIAAIDVNLDEAKRVGEPAAGEKVKGHLLAVIEEEQAVEADAASDFQLKINSLRHTNAGLKNEIRTVNRSEVQA